MRDWLVGSFIAASCCPPSTTNPCRSQWSARTVVAVRLWPRREWFCFVSSCGGRLFFPDASCRVQSMLTFVTSRCSFMVVSNDCCSLLGHARCSRIYSVVPWSRGWWLVSYVRSLLHLQMMAGEFTSLSLLAKYVVYTQKKKGVVYILEIKIFNSICTN